MKNLSRTKLSLLWTHSLGILSYSFISVVVALCLPSFVLLPRSKSGGSAHIDVYVRRVFLKPCPTPGMVHLPASCAPSMGEVRAVARLENQSPRSARTLPQQQKKKQSEWCRENASLRQRRLALERDANQLFRTRSDLQEVGFCVGSLPGYI